MIIDSHRNPFYLFFLFANTRKSWTWHIGYKWTDSYKRVQFILKLNLIWVNLFTQSTISRIQLWRLTYLFYRINFIIDRGGNGFENMTEIARTPALHISWRRGKVLTAAASPHFFWVLLVSVDSVLFTEDSFCCDTVTSLTYE